eukprot:g1029.t1
MSYSVDVSVWLHKGIYTCAWKLAHSSTVPDNNDEETSIALASDAYIRYCFKRIRQLESYGFEVFLVFDGGLLPSKAYTETERERRRFQAQETALSLEQRGLKKEALQAYAKSIDVTPTMARRVQLELLEMIRLQQRQGEESTIDDEKYPAKAPQDERSKRTSSTPSQPVFIVAPYEADAQLAFLCRSGFVDYVLTEDSDLLPYGSGKVLLKLQDQFSPSPIVDLVQLSDLLQHPSKSHRSYNFHPLSNSYPLSNSSRPSHTLNFQGWSINHFIGFCVLCGCDYVPNLQGMGVTGAYTLMKRFKNLPNYILPMFRFIRMEEKYRLPADVDTYTPLEILEERKRTAPQTDNVIGNEKKKRRKMRISEKWKMYQLMYWRATCMFRHGRVYNPETGTCQMLNPRSASSPLFWKIGEDLHSGCNLPKETFAKLDFLGPVLDPSVIQALAQGDLHPIQRKAYPDTILRKHLVGCMATNNDGMRNSGALLHKPNTESTSINRQHKLTTFFPVAQMNLKPHKMPNNDKILPQRREATNTQPRETTNTQPREATNMQQRGANNTQPRETTNTQQRETINSNVESQCKPKPQLEQTVVQSKYFASFDNVSSPITTQPIVSKKTFTTITGRKTSTFNSVSKISLSSTRKVDSSKTTFYQNLDEESDDEGEDIMSPQSVRKTTGGCLKIHNHNVPALTIEYPERNDSEEVEQNEKENKHLVGEGEREDGTVGERKDGTVVVIHSAQSKSKKRSRFSLGSCIPSPISAQKKHKQVKTQQQASQVSRTSRPQNVLKDLSRNNQVIMNNVMNPFDRFRRSTKAKSITIDEVKKKDDHRPIGNARDDNDSVRDADGNDVENGCERNDGLKGQNDDDDLLIETPVDCEFESSELDAFTNPVVDPVSFLNRFAFHSKKN